MRLASCVSCLLIVPLAASAHHAPEYYDVGQTIALEGEITSVNWSDPHVRIAVRADDGALWMLETNAATTLEESGIVRDSLQHGARVRFAGSPARDGRNALFATLAQLDSGRQIVLAPGGRPARADRVPRSSVTGAAPEAWPERGGSNLRAVALAIWSIVCAAFVGRALGSRMARRSAGAAP